MSFSKPMTAKEALDIAAKMKADAINQRITELEKIYGSVRAVGVALRIDHAYLQRLKAGSKTNPSRSVIRKLGLQNQV